uniref:Uncharacterized protein n=1 Tax=Spermophilus dauricus TaxID=99837 RepID=A0A8C9PJL2_SPEDA
MISDDSDLLPRFIVCMPSFRPWPKLWLETLPKEDLIKFAKKQMMLLQKAKSRCTGIRNRSFFIQRPFFF